MSEIILPDKKIVTLDKAPIADSAETYSLTADQLQLIKSLREQPVLAAKVLLGVTLEWYQAEALEDCWHKRFSIFCWSRQIGKTFLEAVMFALLCCLYPEEDAVFIAPSLRQAMNPYNYVREFYANHAVFRSMVRGKITKTRVEFKNGSSMVPLPQGDGCCADALLMGINGLFYIEDAVEYRGEKEHIPSDAKLMGESGFRDVEYFFYNGHVPIKTIRTKRGYELKASLIHPIRAIKENDIFWIKTPDLQIKDRVVIERTEEWFPQCNDITYDQAYTIGAMVGDGNYTVQYWLGFANSPQDREILNYVNIGLKTIIDEQFIPISDEFHFIVRSKSKRLDFFKFFGMPDYGDKDDRAYAKNKSIPKKILSCSKESMRGFLQGLFDTDGHVCQGAEMREVGLTNTSKRLVSEVQCILLKFGIICSVTSRQRKTWNRVYELKITGQDVVLFADRIGFRLKRKQDELERIVKASKRNYSLTDQIYHINGRILNIINKYGQPQVQTYTDGRHTVLQRVRGRINENAGISYDMLAKFLAEYENHEDLIEGCAKGDPDYIYLQDIYNKHYYYDEIESLEDGEADTYDAYIPDDHTFWSNGFISHNTKILGTHASIIGIDEYATFAEEFINTVVMPMANRKKNPLSRGNRLSIISTPLSKSNHYYGTFCRYKKEMAKPNSDYHVSTYTFLDSDNMDLDVLADQIKAMPWIRFSRENLAEFTATAGGFFPEELIRKAQDEIEVELTGERDTEGKIQAVYCLGIDPPSVNNTGGIVIMKLTDNNKKANLVFCAGIPASEIDAPELMGLIIRIVRRFEIKRIHIDQGGGGLQIADFLFKPQIIVDSYQPKTDIAIPAPLSDQVIQWAGAHDIRDEMSMMNKRLEDVIIQIVPFSPLQKSALYFNFKNGLDHQDIILPAFKMGKKYVEIEALKGEMEMLQGTLTSSKLLHLDKPKDANDDRSDAAVLAYDACLAYLRQGCMPRYVEGLSHQESFKRTIGDFDTIRGFDMNPRDWDNGRNW